jgi:predicted component of type VI protein secretion system
MTKEEIREIIDGLAESLREHSERAAQQRADDVLGRVLGNAPSELRYQVQNTIRSIVKEEVAKHLDITVTWR